ncbi:hypothetical protein HID58_001655 [Brassica napus]|uniref:Tryptophan synthase n=1 Tax=Brassica napus TaxID=3708 RepID=A0ABQ8EKM4_BRANA|nr:hypothetical protein HID58_001655 [Brassica napus]
MSYLLQDDDGQITEPHSISAGLDYPGVGPELSFLKDVGRAEYCRVTDEEALEAVQESVSIGGDNSGVGDMHMHWLIWRSFVRGYQMEPEWS